MEVKCPLRKADTATDGCAIVPLAVELVFARQRPRGPMLLPVSM